MAVMFWTGSEFISYEELRTESKRIDLPNSLKDTGGNPFTQIGVGKPLSVTIRTTYVGDLPGWGSSKDILIVSGIKAAQTFEVSGRAINLLANSVRQRTVAEFSAFTPGSPVVYYSKSLTDYEIRATFEVIPDTFKAETIDKVKNLFNMAAGLPVFAPASLYLMAGAFLVGIFKELGVAFLESGPVLTDTINLTFKQGGLPDFQEGFYKVTNEDHENSGEFKDFGISVDGTSVRLVDGDGKEYAGNASYMIVSIDGASNSNLEAFESRVAAAAVLEKFYPKSDGVGVLVNSLSDAARLYNDLQSREKGLALRKRIEQNPNDPLRENLVELYEAYRKSIVQEEFALPPL